MKTPKTSGSTRREFLRTAGRAAAASALAGVSIPAVHAQGDSTIQLALVGCGGRGGGAVNDAMNSKYGPVKLVAMADVFENRLKSTFEALKRQFGDRVDVPPERRFISFDGYKQAMDTLRKGDVAIFATPPAFRWVHFQYAVEKGLNVFMEKPVTVDGPSTRRILELAKKAEEKNLKVGVGLMCRHCHARKALFEKIKDGLMGDLVLLRSYRMHSPVGSAFSAPKPHNISELLWQIQRFHSFLWASGGLFSDFNIHGIDEMCWMKDAWPVMAQATGGRHYRGNNVDQNFDNYSVEYTFADGTKAQFYSRIMEGCHEHFSTYAHGTKGAAIICLKEHTSAQCRIHKGQSFENKADIVWRWGKAEPNPYVLEWDDLLDAIRNNRPYNEARRGAEASLVTAMGRFAAHTGQVVTFDQMLQHQHEFAPDLDKLTFESPAPLPFGADGKYPVPEPGKKKTREY